MNIVVLLSGSGSNFQAILDAIDNGDLPNVKIIKVIADREAHGVNRAIDHAIPYAIVSRKLIDFDKRLSEEIPANTDLVVLAGFLSILPESIIKRFSEKIINIHPSLLPKYGGNGMYGIKVHEAVIKAGEPESGCTVHYVDAGVDTGQIIAQKKVTVTADDTAQSLQMKVLAKEHQLLPEVILLLSIKSNKLKDK